MIRDESDDGAGVSSGAPTLPFPAPLRWAGVLAEVAGGVALLALMLLTVSDALLRSFANRPILGAGDMVQVILVVVVACSVPLCAMAGRAIAVDLFVRRLPAVPLAWVYRLTGLGAAAMLGFLAWRCYVNAGEAAMFGETTMLLRIPFGPYYMILAISFGISALLFLTAALRGRSLG
jgi:TRAP-type transport system small permease protein